jgi:hypothetical protein
VRLIVRVCDDSGTAAPILATKHYKGTRELHHRMANIRAHVSAQRPKPIICTKARSLASHCSISIPSLLRSHRSHGLRVVEQVIRVKSRLQPLQLRKTLPIVRLPCSRLIKPRVGVIDVHAPIVLCQRCCDVGHPVIEEREAVRRVGSEEREVVELDEVELVSVGVRGHAEVAVCDGGVGAAVEVELEPPASAVLGAAGVPVVDEVAQGGAVEAFERQAFGVEVLLLVLYCQRWIRYGHNAVIGLPLSTA